MYKFRLTVLKNYHWNTIRATYLGQIKVYYGLFNHRWSCVVGEMCSFRLVLEGKTGKGIPESSRLEFLGNLLASNFALSDSEDNTSGPVNRRGIANLSFLRTLLAICKKTSRTKFLGSDGC